MDFIKEWWTVLWAMVLTVTGVIQVLLAKTYAKREELEAVTMAVDQLKAKVEALPSSDEMHALQLDISELRGDLKGLKEQLKPAQHLIQLMLEDRLKGRP